jgi:hypothetical protein
MGGCSRFWGWNWWVGFWVGCDGGGFTWYVALEGVISTTICRRMVCASSEPGLTPCSEVMSLFPAVESVC